ncbi:hypothetical protein FHS43_004460 [Streptosporangium becharense]|uniref:Uncharacterized protein n=1 Tax=Streptosporangium becharense TaxID=1816182 RepID=A0A7W9MIM3_9ACTN|nr:hypothetical protein [Streptosporangium becharense]MBB2913162.1 hypothetical protein [Streptosporangium becharense]MBB5822145.1 hypothetical protein [Streptosporangium becharense]
MPVQDSAALGAARRLGEALARYGIAVIVKGERDLAVVSVCEGLTVWCNGERFWWQAGWDPQRRCLVNASQEVSALDRAAGRIAEHYATFRQRPSGCGGQV